MCCVLAAYTCILCFKCLLACGRTPLDKHDPGCTSTFVASAGLPDVPIACLFGSACCTNK